MSAFKAAAAHATPVFLDTAATVDKAIALIADAASQGAELLVFPEVFLPGFPHWINCYPPIVQTPMNLRYQAASIEVPGPEVRALQDAARRDGVYLVIGVSERDGGSLYNTQVHIDDRGQLLGKHRKLQPTYAERYIWGQGDGSTLTVWETRLGRVGGLACWEHTMNLARHALIVQGEQIHAGSWPSLSTLAGFQDVFDDQVEAMSRNHAITGQTFVIVATSPVGDDVINIMDENLGPQEFLSAGGGWSAIIHPMTPYLAGPYTGPDETILVADIDLAEIVAVKSFVDATGHYSRRDLLRLDVDREPKDAVRYHGDPVSSNPLAGPPQVDADTSTAEQ